MLTFLRTHWLPITICLVVSLIAAGGSYYFVNSAIKKNKNLVLKMEGEIKTAKNTLEKANLEASKHKLALDNEKVQNTELKKLLAAAEQERESLRHSLETMTLTVNKASATPTAKTKTAPAAKATTACPDKNAAANKKLEIRLRELQAFQADVYKRDSELRQRQQQLDEILAKQAEEMRKLDREKSEYRWPHNNIQPNK